MQNSNINNLNSYYSSNPKVEIPQHTVVTAPESLPSMHLYNDIDANKRMRAINRDIYERTEQEKSSFGSKFFKFFAGISLTVLGLIYARKFFK